MPKGSVFPSVAVKKPSRSNVNLSTTRRFSCNIGTLIPALTLPVQSGDKIHMSISSLVKTLPFVAPLMGSFKIQMDTFYFPYRYYNSWLHDDRTDFDPYDIKFPLLRYGLLQNVSTTINKFTEDEKDENSSIYPNYNVPAPGSLLNFLGVGYDLAPFSPALYDFSTAYEASTTTISSRASDVIGSGSSGSDDSDLPGITAPGGGSSGGGSGSSSGGSTSSGGSSGSGSGSSSGSGSGSSSGSGNSSSPTTGGNTNNNAGSSSDSDDTEDGEDTTIESKVIGDYRYINAVPLLGYWDIFRSYYANTQEPLFYFVSSYEKIYLKDISTTTPSKQIYSQRIALNNSLNLQTVYLSTIDDARQALLKIDGDRHVIIPMFPGDIVSSNDNNSNKSDIRYPLFPYESGSDDYRSPYFSINSYAAQGGLALKTYKSDRFTTWLNADTYYENMASSSMLVSNVPTQLSAFTPDDEGTYRSLINSNQLGVTYRSNTTTTTPTESTNLNQFSDITLGGDAVNKYQDWDGYGLSYTQSTNLGYQYPINNAQFTNVYGGTVYGAQHPRQWNQFWTNGSDPSKLNVPFEISSATSNTDDTSIIFNDWSSRGNVAIGRLSMDALYFASHLDRMLKRTQLAGGRYSDWNYVQYGNSIRAIVEAPTFIRSHSFTLSCEDVVQTSESSADSPLGSLAGRGRGGAVGRHVNFFVPEHGFIMTIFSISPYVDYSQGVSWYLRMTSLGDIHVPVLDGIGFQDLISDDLTTACTVTPQSGTGNLGNDYHYGYYGIGKQPAFIEWMTNENRVYGDFADPDRFMYMTLCRRFASWKYTGSNGTTSESTSANSNLTNIAVDYNFSSYIDPRDWNYCFADTSLESQNFWVQLAFHITAKRVISKKIMPHL